MTWFSVYSGETKLTRRSLGRKASFNNPKTVLVGPFPTRDPYNARLGWHPKEAEKYNVAYQDALESLFPYCPKDKNTRFLALTKILVGVSSQKEWGPILEMYTEMCSDECLTVFQVSQRSGNELQWMVELDGSGMCTVFVNNEDWAKPPAQAVFGPPTHPCELSLNCTSVGNTIFTNPDAGMWRGWCCKKCLAKYNSWLHI